MHDGLIGLGAYRSGEAVLPFSKDLASFLQAAQIPAGGNLKGMEASGRRWVDIAVLLPVSRAWGVEQ